MKKSNNNNFAVFLTTILCLALAGCQNPFLQLGKEAVSPFMASHTEDSEDSAFSVSFVTNGGSAVPKMTGLAPGSIINEPASFKDHYIVEGWYSEEGWENLWDFASNTVNSNITLYAKWVFDGIQGVGTAIDPFIVYDLATLNRVGRETTGGNPWDLTKHYLQIEDITYTGAGWTPIGSSGGFSGTYRGGGHTISGIHIMLATNDVGLFYTLNSGAMVEGLGLLGVNIVGGYETGGIAGHSSGMVKNCYVTGSVSGDDEAGGVVGCNDGTIEYCYADLTFQGRGQSGGIAGYNAGAVLSCYALGEVSGGNEFGGVVGFNDGEISNCFFMGDISGTFRVGGVVGVNCGSVKNCFAWGNVSGDNTVGGIVGSNHGVDSVKNCVSLCQGIDSTTMSLNRIISDSGSGSSDKNYARLGMKLNGVANYNPGSASGNEGEGITETEYESDSWWMDNATWFSLADAWDFATVWEWDAVKKLPVLR